MTDLTTMHLKCLLEKAAPGPWEYEGPEFGEITTLDSNGFEQAVIALHRYTEKELCNRPDDFELAAAASELAQEVIRLRENIEELITAMEEKAAIGESQSPAIIAGYLKEKVLGDHDE